MAGETKATHTPGPWEIQHCIDGGFLIEGTSDGDHILIAQRAAIQKRMFEFEANARLIAAAPDLLVAAKAALNDRMYTDWPGIADLLIAAIAKAEGQ